VDADLRRRIDQLQQAAGELLQMGLGEMAIQRLAVGPFLHGYKAERILDGGVEAVAQAARPGRAVTRAVSRPRRAATRTPSGSAP